MNALFGILLSFVVAGIAVVSGSSHNNPVSQELVNDASQLQVAGVHDNLGADNFGQWVSEQTPEEAKKSEGNFGEKVSDAAKEKKDEGNIGEPLPPVYVPPKPINPPVTEPEPIPYDPPYPIDPPRCVEDQYYIMIYPPVCYFEPEIEK